MDDGIAAGKRRERLRPQQAMGIGNRANGSHHARPAYKMIRVSGASFAPTPVGRLMVIAGAEGPNWRRSPVLDIGRREFITLLGGAAIFVYLLSRTFFPMAVRTYSSCRLLSVCRSTNPLLTSRSIGRRSLSLLN